MQNDTTPKTGRRRALQEPTSAPANTRADALAPQEDDNTEPLTRRDARRRAPAGSDTARSAAYSKLAVTGFTLSLILPFSLIGLLISRSAFQRTERQHLRGGQLAIAGVVLGAINTTVNTVVIVGALMLIGPVSQAIDKYAPAVDAIQNIIGMVVPEETTSSSIDPTGSTSGAVADTGIGVEVQASAGETSAVIPHVAGVPTEDIDAINGIIPEGASLEDIKKLLPEGATKEDLPTAEEIERIKKVIPKGMTLDQLAKLIPEHADMDQLRELIAGS